MHYIIGDIHGCYNTLLRLINQIPFKKGDKLVFVGDYIDRGKYSKQVVSYIKELVELGDAIALKGNHEDMAISFYNGQNYFDQLVWVRNGGIQTIKSYYPDLPFEKIDIYDTKEFRIDQDHLDWFETLPTHIEIGDYFISHAGALPEVSLEDQIDYDLLWIRNEFIFSDYKWDKKIVFGHTSLKKVMIAHNKIGIDTGCVYGFCLSCICLENLNIFQENTFLDDIEKS